MLPPLFSLVHEVGHAFAIYNKTGRRSLVIIGGDPPLFHHSFRAFELRFHPWNSYNGGVCRFDSRGLTVTQLREILRAGPLAAYVLALLFAAGALAIANPDSVVFWSCVLGFAYGCWHAIRNLVPQMTSAGAISDGLELRKLQPLDSEHVVKPHAPPRPPVASYSQGSGTTREDR